MAATASRGYRDAMTTRTRRLIVTGALVAMLVLAVVGALLG